MPAGRPTALNKEIQDKVVLHISEGNYRHVAAEAAGIPIRTFNRWCADGRKASSGIYHDFWQAILKAEREAEIKAVKSVLDDPDPRQKQWWLERKFPERWGRDREQLKQLARDIAELRKMVSDGHAATKNAGSRAEPPAGSRAEEQPD